MSLLFHLVVFVLLAILVKPPTRPVNEEPERSVGIVVSRRTPQDQRTYFDEQTADEQPSGGESASDSATATTQQALPDADQSPVLAPALPLPADDGPFAANDRALADVALSSGGRPGLVSKEGVDEIIAADLARQKARGGPVGPPTQVSLFGSAAMQGHSFVFVIDRSQSMGDAGLGVLRAAESQLERALTALAENHKFQIIVYNKTPLAFHLRGMAPATAENKRAAIEYVRNLTALGGTGHFAALLAATRQEPDVIFLLTDGGDPFLTRPEVEEVTRRVGRRTQIVCLQFGFGATPHDNAALQSLAERTGGSYRYIDMSRHRTP